MDRVLVVDDSTVNRKLLVRSLKGLGLAVSDAENGAEAIQVVKDSPPFALIFMDLNMPVMGGLQAMQELRAQGYTMPIVALSGDTPLSPSTGFSASLTKPAMREDLVTVLKRFKVHIVESNGFNRTLSHSNSTSAFSTPAQQQTPQQPNSSESPTHRYVPSGSGSQLPLFFDTPFSTTSNSPLVHSDSNPTSAFTTPATNGYQRQNSIPWTAPISLPSTHFSSSLPPHPTSLLSSSNSDTYSTVASTDDTVALIGSTGHRRSLSALNIEPHPLNVISFSSSGTSASTNAASTTNGASSSAPTSTTAAAKRVLVVEDSPINQKLVVRLLQLLGCSADIANNGEEALTQVNKYTAAHGSPYPLIYMDLNMPVMDGWEATTRLRQSGYTMPIVALTANALEESRRRCVEGGFSGFITKPFNKNDLEQVLRQYHVK
jgi:CheY-like chemotaxis protein